MHSPALDELRAQQLNKAIKAQLLPRGTKSASKSSPNFSAPVAEKKIKLVDVNKSNRANSQYIDTGMNYDSRGRRLAQLGGETLMRKQMFLQARHHQTIRGQAETVEQHMSMTKPVNHRYPQPEKAHDYADDWTRENHVQTPKSDTGYLKSLREALDRTA